MNKWIPIEECPMDGTMFMLGCADGRIAPETWSFCDSCQVVHGSVSNKELQSFLKENKEHKFVCLPIYPPAAGNHLN